MGGGGGPQLVTFTLQVELDQLNETSEQEIRDQLNELLESVGAKGVEFEPFEEGSTIVTAISKKSFNVDTLKEKITSSGNVKTIQYTNKDTPTVTNTTLYSKVDDEELVYSDDLILVDTDNATHYGSVEEDGVITRAIVDEAVPGRNIQCVICGGKSTSIADGIDEETTVFDLIDTLTTFDFGPVETIGNVAFGACNSLTTIDFRDVQTIGKRAFVECTSLTTIDFKQANTIGEGAFGACNSLTTIDFGQVETIGKKAFGACTSLNIIDFKQVNTIVERAFEDCSSLREVRLNFNQDWNIQAGVFFLSSQVTIPVVDGTAENPFLVHKDITTISFGSLNGLFSNLSAPDGGLVLVDYPEDPNYKRVALA